MGKEYARITRTVSQMGRSRAIIKCACGGTVIAYLWSWAGHSKKRCPTCQRWIAYDDLEVYEGERNRDQS